MTGIVVVLFSTASFLGAFLLFVVEPLIGKAVLPALGGAPAVWNTCVLFFQGGLLTGYLYAHLLASRVAPPVQPLIHAIVLLAAASTLPFDLQQISPPPDADPAWWLLLVLLKSVTLPFLVLAATAPLLQAWLARSRHPAGADPYFLYAASNLGSLVALCAYPLGIEPLLGVREQTGWWTGGYWLYGGLLLTCAVIARRHGTLDFPGRLEHAAVGAAAPAPLPLSHVGLWVGLAFIPSSLMLSVTTYITSDIAAVPLLWVIPLGIYLISFILVFRRPPFYPRRVLSMLLPAVLLAPVITWVIGSAGPLWQQLAPHLLVLFVGSMVCHGELSLARPRADRLTVYYLCLAAGGVLGGAFNSLIAPIVFDTHLEYPLGLVLVALVRPPIDRPPAPFNLKLDVGVPLLVAVLVVVLAAVTPLLGMEKYSVAALSLVIGFPLLVCATLWPEPRRFAVALAVLLVATRTYMAPADVLYQGRSFFGIFRVQLDSTGSRHVLFHGNTIHGSQSVQPEARTQPTGYYSRTGPVGDIFRAMAGRKRPLRVAVAGLGAGGLAAYARPGDEWTFYEISPDVVRIARTPELFTYLSDAPVPVRITLGDARLSLAKEPERSLDLLIVDVFSSDAIPAHLLTRQAAALYRRKLAPGGVLVIHTSNRYIELRPLVATVGATVGLVARERSDLEISEQEGRLGKLPSQWMALSGDPASLGSLAHDPRWQTPATDSRTPVWTDDFTNIVAVLRR